MRGTSRPKDSEMSGHALAPAAAGLAPALLATRDLVKEILEIAPELDGPTAAGIARRLEAERAVSARQVAEHLGLRKTDWVYAIGGRRLGEGRGARWRFYLSEVDERLREFGGRQAEPRSGQAGPRWHAPRRGKRRPGVTASGNALLDF